MKRGQSGLSLLVGVNKAVGMSSHDVVNACRRIFEERRVGHTGTLDPMAQGVLPICVGPATRLDKYLTGHAKRYRVGIGFGYETTTDDVEGQVSVRADVPANVLDESFASSFVASLKGTHSQLPPAYSAIKVNGVKAYEAARKGRTLDLEFRDIEIFDAAFEGLREENGIVVWEASFFVSKGTYIRSLARDVGRMLGTAAHVRSLMRTASGSIRLEDCLMLHTIEQLDKQAALDPVAALGFRYAFADEAKRKADAGSALRCSEVQLFEPLSGRAYGSCACMGRNVPSERAPQDGELASIVVDNRLKGIYRYDWKSSIWKPDCVFSIGVMR